MFYYIILFYFNPPKSIGGMEGEGLNKFDRDSEFSGGSQGMEEEKDNLKHYFVLFLSSKIYRRNGGRGTE